MPVSPPPATAGIDQEVLDVVTRLVAELNGSSTRRASLGDALDRDLGIGSLERVELLLRLEQVFGVRLPDSVMANAVTPRDLVEAIGRAAPAWPSPPQPGEPRITPGAPATIPETARSLVDALRWHAERSPGRTHIHLRNDDDSETPITYGELARAAARAGAGLTDLGIGKGDRVALMLRTERAFFDTFFGALLIGAVPVPLYPPVRAEDLVAYTARQQAILRNAGARVLVTFAEAERMAALIRGQVPSIDAIITADDLAAAAVRELPDRMAADDPALIQYTSGSTGAPKGVLLSHGNLLANIRAIGAAFEIRSDDAAVGWLPLYHDMGLIGLWLGSLYFGVPVAIMSPLAFLSRPSRWLWSIHRHGGTISAAPNFAYDLCARRIPDAELAGLDLSRWRVAVNGSEAVSPETVERFVGRFAPYGFKAASMCPAYGLAEASVALTLGGLGHPPRVDALAREPFERRRAVHPAVSESTPVRFVSCGRPLRDHDIRIVDDRDQPVDDRTEGHVQFRSPSMTRGYFHDSAATRAAMHDGWMDTGDLGYRADDELFITGRQKDLIKQGGRNLCAEEIEAIASGVPGVRPSCVAAFGVHDPQTGTERVVVVAESRETDRDRRDALRRAVTNALVTGVGSPPDIVVIAAPHTVLKTSSGKIRRGAMRDAYAAGTLGVRRSAAAQRARLLAGAAAARFRRGASFGGRAAFTAWVDAVIVTTLPLLWACLSLRQAGPHAHRAAARWSRFALTICGLRPHVVGLEHLRGLASGVIVANHASYIDPVVLLGIIPGPFHFLAKRSLMAYPVIGAVIHKAGHVTVERTGVSERLAGADALEQRLREGDRLLIFPEGTFVRGPGLLPFRLGAFRAAVETHRPIVPVAIAGTRRVLPDGTWLFQRSPITVTIGAPLVPEAAGWPEMVRLRDAALHHIERFSGESASEAPPSRRS